MKGEGNWDLDWDLGGDWWMYFPPFVMYASQEKKQQRPRHRIQFIFCEITIAVVSCHDSVL
jgi:hypothetical protein